MKQQFYIKGMHCDGCRNLLTRTLMDMPGVTSARINLDSGKTIIETSPAIAIDVLAEKIKKAGHYSLELKGPGAWSIAKKKLKTFRPLIIAFAIIITWTIIHQSMVGYEFHSAMLDFMGAFFLIFGGLKVINWKKFAESYRSYDPLAKVSKLYAYAYPAIEMYLGASYTFRLFSLTLANFLTVIILGIATVGIINVLDEDQPVKCACLGGFFNIPITLVTVAENLLMIIMAASMQFAIWRI